MAVMINALLRGPRRYIVLSVLGGQGIAGGSVEVEFCVSTIFRDAFFRVMPKGLTASVH
jgi:hypothetical protein